MTIVTPQTDDQGNVVGYDVSNQKAYDSSKDLQDFVLQEDDTYKHMFQDVELNEEPNQGFDFDEYVGDIQQVYPALGDAVGWLADQEGYQQLAESWNHALDTQDLEEVNKLTEHIIELYLQENEFEYDEDEETSEYDTDEEDESSEIEEWFDNLSDEHIENAVTDIYDAEFSAEQADVMDSLSYSYEKGSVHHTILQLGQSLADQSISPEDAIDMVVEQYGDATAAAAYFELQQILQSYQ